MASSSIKFSNNPQGTSFTAQNINADGKDVKITSISGYSTSSVAGKTINQVEIVNSKGGKQQLIVKGPGAGKNDKSCVSPDAGNNIINYPEPINVDMLTIMLTKT